MRKHQLFHNSFGAISCAFLLFLTTLAGCSSHSTDDASTLTLADWVQPGWMVETLAEREEYAVKVADCYDRKGAKEAIIINGSALISFTEYTGNVELDNAQKDLNQKAIFECQDEIPMPEETIDDYEVEYGKYVDLYQCLTVHEVDLPAQLSKESWLEAFGKWAPGNFGKPEIYDPYTIISTEGGPYHMDRPQATEIQGTCIKPVWSLGL